MTEQLLYMHKQRQVCKIRVKEQMYLNLPCTLDFIRLALEIRRAAYLFVENRENPPDHYVSTLKQAWHVKAVEQFTARSCENKQR